MNEIKIKYDYFFLIFGENEREYAIAIEAVCLTSTCNDLVTQMYE